MKTIKTIAEIGINHNGDINIAKELIDMAVRCGCDYVKFQKRSIDKVYTPEELSKFRESPWGTTQREQKEGLEFSQSEYDEIDDYCRHQGIAWFASAWDEQSLEFLDQFSSPVNKVASAMTTNLKFLESVAARGRYTYISTGMCTLADIDAAVNIFEKSRCGYCLMHSVSIYPAEDSELNLLNIPMLAQRYECEVGYSGHEKTVSPSLIAAVLGATTIERHITLDRTMYGSDQSASLEEHGLSSLMAQLAKLPVVLGTHERIVSDREREVANKLRYWER